MGCGEGQTEQNEKIRYFQTSSQNQEQVMMRLNDRRPSQSLAEVVLCFCMQWSMEMENCVLWQGVTVREE